jgi:hypothetical protein
VAACAARGAEVAAGRAAVARARPESGRRLEALHTGGGCMCGAWSQEAAGSGQRGRQLGGGGRNRGTVRTRAGRSRFERQHCSTGPGPILCTVTFCNYSNFDQISKYKLKAILMSKIIETCHGARVDHSKQFLPLGPLPMLNIIQVIKLGTTPL